MNMRSPHTTPNRQNGAVLAICLILLLVMTVVGVSAMNGARLEISMASLMQKEEVALRRAERTLIEAEEDVTLKVAVAGPYDFSTGSDAYYRTEDYAVDTPVNARVKDWSALNAASGPIYSADGLDNDDVYVIEYLGEKVVPGGDEGVQQQASIAVDRINQSRSVFKNEIAE